MDALSGTKKGTIADLQKERSRLTKRAFGGGAKTPEKERVPENKFSSRNLHLRTPLSNSPVRIAPLSSREENLDVISKQIGKLFDGIESNTRKHKIGPGPLESPTRNKETPTRNVTLQQLSVWDTN